MVSESFTERVMRSRKRLMVFFLELGEKLGVFSFEVNFIVVLKR